MEQAINETNRRRSIQLQFNTNHHITPKTVEKAVRRGIELELRARQTVRDVIADNDASFDREELISQMEKQMLKAAESLEFERAAGLRDQIRQLRDTPEISPARR